MPICILQYIIKKYFRKLMAEYLFYVPEAEKCLAQNSA